VPRLRMRGAIPPLSSMPSKRGAQLNNTGTPLPLINFRGYLLKALSKLLYMSFESFDELR